MLNEYSTKIICVLIIALLFSICFIYYTKRRFDSIEQYNEKIINKMTTSYKENQEQYNKNLERIGIKCIDIKNIVNFVKKIAEIIHKKI